VLGERRGPLTKPAKHLVLGGGACDDVGVELVGQADRAIAQVACRPDIPDGELGAPANAP
jgi:hypothetical protein